MGLIQYLPFVVVIALLASGRVMSPGMHKRYVEDIRSKLSDWEFAAARTELLIMKNELEK